MTLRTHRRDAERSRRRWIIPAFLYALALLLPAAAQATQISFQRILVSGNAAIGNDAINAITANYLNRPLADEDLQTLLQQLGALYSARGFRSSRAVLPDQRLDAGELKVEILEAGLADVMVEGASALDPSWLKARIQRGLGRPLNVDRLNDNLRLLLRERVVENLKAEFRPGPQRDLQILKVTVTEGPSYGLGLRVANDRSPSVGSVRGGLEASARNLLGRGDQLDVVVGRAEGLSDYDLRLRTPLNVLGTELAARYAKFTSNLIEEQFVVLGAETESDSAEIGLTQALYRSAPRQIALSARYTARNSQSFLLGRPYSFSAEAVDGRVDVEALRLALQWTERLPRDVLFLRVGANIGVGGTEHAEPVPDARFVSIQIQAQWLRQFGPRWGQMVARGDLQLASEPLVSMERYAVGGWGSVRGYRRGRLVSDNGWSASLEYRLPLFRLPLPGGNETEGQLSLVSFLDVGEGWNERPGKLPPTLAALGPGLRWDASKLIRAEVYWGALRNHVPETDPDLQDDGVHFQIAARLGF